MAEPTRTGVDVVTFGEVLLALSATPGTPLDRATAFEATVAGAEFNVAAALSRLGHQVRLITRVGDDFAGALVRRGIRAEGIDDRGAAVESTAPTGLLFRDVHADRPLTVEYRRTGSAGSRLSPTDIVPEFFRGARLLYLSGITPMLSASAHRAAVHAVSTARAAGIAVCIDPNIRHRLGSPATWRATVGPLLFSADIVLGGVDELAALLGSGGVNLLLDHHPCTVVTRSADRSATAHTRGGTVTRAAFSIVAADPVGAGDAFAAGFLSAHLRGVDLPTALEEAATVAALTVASTTDTLGHPTAAIRDHARAAFLHNAESTLR